MVFDFTLQEFTAETTSVRMLIPSGDKRIEELADQLGILSRNVQVRLYYYANLCVRLEKLFVNEKEVFKTRLGEVAERMEKYDEDDEYTRDFRQSQFVQQQWLFGERVEVQEAAVAIGVFLKAYALFEDVLNEICEIYKELKLCQKGYKDLEGGGIVRAARYINNVVKINNFSKNEWKMIRYWNTVRNQVMHEDAKMNDDPRLMQAMKKLGINSVRDTTLGNNKVINIKLEHVKNFLVLIDINLSNFVLHEDKWKYE